MEVVGAYCIFERSNVRNVQYNEYYGDGDSKGYESVKNFYGINTVTKLECIGHVQKRVAGRLRQLKKTTKDSVAIEVWSRPKLTGIVRGKAFLHVLRRRLIGCPNSRKRTR
ncbi:uncharacterized protein LOC101238613 [Trichonephila clavipes]|nr:uncharacterized protein LOC101238613 [Trichonephila clavipes]